MMSFFFKLAYFSFNDAILLIFCWWNEKSEKMRYNAVYPHTGADLQFSQGGGGFSKKFWNFFVDLFFLGRPNLFSELFQSTTKTLFCQKFLRRRQNVEKTGQKKAFLGTFWKLFTKTSRFFGARSHLKKCAFRKILGSVTKNGYFKIVQRGDPLGRQGIESLRGASEFCPISSGNFLSQKGLLSLLSSHKLFTIQYWLN